jgi:hypothetical protein
VKKLIALVAVAGTLLLSACSQVGTAATIGSTKISQTTVQKSIDETLKERTKVDTSGMSLETGAAFNRNQLRFHLIAELLSEIAADQKITVTKAQIDARRAEIVQQIGGEEKLAGALVNASIAPGDFLKYIELILNSEKIGAAIQANGVSADQTSAEIQKLIIAKAAAVKVTINPRYGKWDPVAGDIVAGDAASPAATPAASSATE